MILTFALLLTPEPALITRQAFPESWGAKQQVSRCHEHAIWLKGVRSRRGYEDGRWDLWIAQTRQDEAAWGILAGAEPDLNEKTMRLRLEAYRKLVGDWRYLKRWHPPEYQEPPFADKPWYDPTGAKNP